MSNKDKEIKDTKMITSFSMMVKKKASESATPMKEDVKEAKVQHRQAINSLINKYYQDVEEGKAEGIRNAKELVEVMKMDMLLMGEATERTQTTTDIDEVKLSKFTQTITENIDGDEGMQNMVNAIFAQLNGYNDDQDDAPQYKGDIPDMSEGVQVYSGDKDKVVEEIAEQSIADKKPVITTDEEGNPLSDEDKGYDII